MSLVLNPPLRRNLMLRRNEFYRVGDASNFLGAGGCSRFCDSFTLRPPLFNATCGNDQMD